MIEGLRDCQDCKLCLSRSSPVPGYGNVLSPIFVLGEAPGRQEDEEGTPFVGRAGQELARRMWDAGFNLDSLYRTNVVKCWPGPGDPKPKVKHTQACRKWLDEELEEIKPKVVLALGAIAIRAAMELKKPVRVREVRGIPVHVNGCERVVLPTYHPSAILRSPRLTGAFVKDLDTLRGMLSGPPAGLTRTSREPLYVMVRDMGLPPDHNYLAIDTETRLDDGLWCVSVSHTPGEAWVVMAEDLHNIKHLFEDPQLTLIFHNASFDLGVLAKAGVNDIKGKVEDTMVMAYAIEEEGLGLKRLAKQHCGMEMQEYREVTEGKGVEGIDLGKAVLYAAKDADATLRLFSALYPKLDERAWKVYNIDMGALPMTVAMRLNGMPVSRLALEQLGLEFEDRRFSAQVDAQESVDREFNLRSSMQVSELLYGEVGLRTGRKTEGGMWSTDDEELTRLAGLHPVVSHIQEYRKWDKMIGSFITPLLAEGGRVYCDLRIAGTVSGRMAASGPNLMAMPQRGLEGKRIRDCFVAREG